MFTYLSADCLLNKVIGALFVDYSVWLVHMLLLLLCCFCCCYAEFCLRLDLLLPKILFSCLSLLLFGYPGTSKLLPKCCPISWKLFWITQTWTCTFCNLIYLTSCKFNSWVSWLAFPWSFEFPREATNLFVLLFVSSWLEGISIRIEPFFLISNSHYLGLVHSFAKILVLFTCVCILIKLGLLTCFHHTSAVSILRIPIVAHVLMICLQLIARSTISYFIINDFYFPMILSILVFFDLWSSFA